VCSALSGARKNSHYAELGIRAISTAKIMRPFPKTPEMLRFDCQQKRQQKCRKGARTCRDGAGLITSQNKAFLV
jgi:hypothetical protein